MNLAVILSGSGWHVCCSEIERGGGPWRAEHLVIKRRDFLKATAGGIAATFIRPAAAQSRKDTLLTLSENGPNNLDIMGVGTNRPGYEASWNTMTGSLHSASSRTPRTVTIATTKISSDNPQDEPSSGASIRATT